MQRGAGILLAVSSLPGPYGIGTLGKSAFEFIDFLAAAGQKYWQILPLGEPDHCGSPYQSVSAFAGGVRYIDFGQLYERGLLSAQELSACRFENGALADLEGQKRKNELLYPAFLRGRTKYAAEFSEFFDENRGWLEDYALFSAISEKLSAQLSAWPGELREREPGALAAAKTELSERVDFYAFAQFLFAEQWKKLHAYAKSKGVSVVGDMPIYVSRQSADLWAGAEYFGGDSAGCPPDYFSPDGQFWGNPVYAWERHRADGFAWWKRRFAKALSDFDFVRVDHFRGFEAYWSIPHGASSAKEGRWENAAGAELFAELSKSFGALPVIAEDLGTITPSFLDFMKKCGFPGLKVLEFAFSGDKNNPYLPHNLIKNSVIYIGTHDNDTAVGWFASLNARTKDAVRRYLDMDDDRDIAPALVREAYRSVCDVCIIPAQDVLGLPTQARMNTPAVVGGGNWRFRLTEGQLGEAEKHRLKNLAEIYGR